MSHKNPETQLAKQIMDVVGRADLCAPSGLTALGMATMQHIESTTPMPGLVFDTFVKTLREAWTMSRAVKSRLRGDS